MKFQGSVALLTIAMCMLSTYAAEQTKPSVDQSSPPATQNDRSKRGLYAPYYTSPYYTSPYLASPYTAPYVAAPYAASYVASPYVSPYVASPYVSTYGAYPYAYYP
ncbi:uncharacterized protein LOC126903566 [Daktulosphaira vitifoliae]|uniref:uncharacterized protein LOC126903566 n=1 Tax=Daktulosphaira vitifoliae TaxID=58002 RepID=UPI0021AA43DE|nr:uncharacterized protein LOC126903566 [Daktulosphaira vitifoliae]